MDDQLFPETSYQQQHPINVVADTPASNTAGLIGLIFSTLGWLTCGLLCPVGLLFSAAGLCNGKPKSLAIAGLVIGSPGLLLIFLFVVPFVAATFAATQIPDGRWSIEKNDAGYNELYWVEPDGTRHLYEDPEETP